MHEAAAADPVRRVVYLTEDETFGCFYRFRPTTWGTVDSLGSGVLEDLVAPASLTSGSVTWARVPDVDGSPTRTRDQVSGAKRFNGGEGCYYSGDKCWFTTKISMPLARRSRSSKLAGVSRRRCFALALVEPGTKKIDAGAGWVLWLPPSQSASSEYFDLNSAGLLLVDAPPWPSEGSRMWRNTVYERVAGIDVGKKIIAVAVRTPGEHPGKRRQQVRKYTPSTIR